MMLLSASVHFSTFSSDRLQSSLLYNKDDNPQPGSVGIGNKLINIARYSPLGLLMAIGATIDDLRQQGEHAEAKGKEGMPWHESVAYGIGDEVARLPLLQNVDSLMKMLKPGQRKEGASEGVAGVVGPIVPGYATLRDIYKGNEQAIRRQFPSVNQAAEKLGARPLEQVKPDLGYAGRVFGVQSAPERFDDRAARLLYAHGISPPGSMSAVKIDDTIRRLPDAAARAMTRERNRLMSSTLTSLQREPEFRGLSRVGRQAALESVKNAVDAMYLNKARLRLAPNHDDAYKWEAGSEKYEPDDLIERAIDKGQAASEKKAARR
jgi:hypothetical protein